MRIVENSWYTVIPLIPQICFDIIGVEIKKNQISLVKKKQKVQINGKLLKLSGWKLLKL